MPKRGPMFCITCGYPLTQIEGDACPECGRTFSIEDSSTYRLDEFALESEAARSRMWKFTAVFVALVAGSAAIAIWLPMIGVALGLAVLIAMGTFAIAWGMYDPILKRDQGQPRSWRENNRNKQLAPLIGREAVAMQVLRPAGDVRIDGQTYTARCAIGSAEVGEKMVVIQIHRGELIVRKP